MREFLSSFGLSLLAPSFAAGRRGRSRRERCQPRGGWVGRRGRSPVQAVADPTKVTPPCPHLVPGPGTACTGGVLTSAGGDSLPFPHSGPSTLVCFFFCVLFFFVSCLSLGRRRCRVAGGSIPAVSLRPPSCAAGWRGRSRRGPSDVTSPFPHSGRPFASTGKGVGRPA